MRPYAIRRGGSPAWWAVPFAFLGAATSALWLSHRFTRYEVSGESMLPTLAPGDWLIADRHAYRWHGPRRGDIVLAADPRQPSRVLVKRVARVDSHGGAFIEGDNPEASTDSRHFGPIGRQAIHARIRWRYFPPGRFGRVR